MTRSRILIIHEEGPGRTAIHNILSRFNFDLVYADDGLQGLEAAKHKTPDLIISQVDLKVLNGMELGATLRKSPLHEDVSMIFLHKTLETNLIKKAKLLKADAFLIKPYVDNSLIYAIKRALGDEYLEVSSAHNPPIYDDCKSTIYRNYKINYA